MCSFNLILFGPLLSHVSHANTQFPMSCTIQDTNKDSRGDRANHAFQGSYAENNLNVFHKSWWMSDFHVLYYSAALQYNFICIQVILVPKYHMYDIHLILSHLFLMLVSSVCHTYDT